MKLWKLENYGEFKVKIAITSVGTNINSDVNSVFGRNPYFILVDLENGEIIDSTWIENSKKNEKGAGNLAAQFIVDQAAEILISGEMGPVAFHILRNAEIKVYKAIQGTIENNLRRFNEGKLEEVISLSSGFPVSRKRSNKLD